MTRRGGRTLRPLRGIDTGRRPRDYRWGMDERVLANFLAPDGRLKTIPSKHAKLLVVLDRPVMVVRPGRQQVLQRHRAEAHPVEPLPHDRAGVVDLDIAPASEHQQ